MKLRRIVKARRAPTRIASRAGAQAPASIAVQEHVCAICGDTSIVATDCGRCDAPMRRGGHAVQVGGRSSSAAWRLASLTTFLAFTVPVATAELAILFQLDRHLNFNLHGASMMCLHNGWVCIAALTVFGAGLFSFVELGPKCTRWLARRSSNRHPMTSLADLAPASDVRVRVSGRILVERLADGSRRIFVTDGTTLVALPEPAEISARTVEGGRSALGSGERVEVEGVVMRRARAGGPYRAGQDGLLFATADVLVLA